MSLSRAIALCLVLAGTSPEFAETPPKEMNITARFITQGLDIYARSAFEDAVKLFAMTDVDGNWVAQYRTAAPAWVHAAPEAERGRRRIVAAAFALELLEDKRSSKGSRVIRRLASRN